MKRLKMINGMKILNRWSGALIFSVIFLLLGVGGLGACLYLFPLIDAVPGSGVGDVYALDFVLAMFGSNTKGISDGFRTWEVNVFPGFETLFQGLSSIVVYVMGALVCLIGLVAVFAVLMFLISLITGRLISFKSPTVWGWLLFVFSLLLNGCVVGLVFLSSMATKNALTFNSFNLLYNYIYAGGALVLAIIIAIIYGVGIKNHLYIKYALRIMDAQNARRAQAASMYPNVYNQGYVPQNAPIAPVAPVGVPVYVNPQPPVEIASPQAAPQPRITPTQVTEVKYVASKGLPPELSSIGGHAFSQNSNLEVAVIPNGIKEIGPSAFSNCPNLKVVSIPTSITKIGYNAFFGCRKLARINYGGRKMDWRHIQRGSNWLASSGTTTVVCVDGAITVNPYH